MGDALSTAEGMHKVFTYRYNTGNPTEGSPFVEHAAENWMMFLGTNIGCVSWIFKASSALSFS